ncbi:LytR C-terminal domain-containing protein [Nocardioides dongkuii]|uniref:LytR C-terminal domain-containing protein n=1 Tax=Nocardioides dongkuii TaxID=2760089 RepID=UPI0015F868A0|nr:LytR C-terminal domain-containing protein [Nocardioides dongkuii]
MTEGARTTTTILVLCGLLAAGLVWGWSATTAPLPKSAEVAACEPTTVAAGEKVYPDQVVVSVLNAGSREGLAGRTMQLLVDEGFVEGRSTNAPKRTDVPFAEVWAEDPRSPAARLVASRLGKNVEVVRPRVVEPGVVVVVGDEFKKLAKGRKAVAADTETTVCMPPGA